MINKKMNIKLIYCKVVVMLLFTIMFTYTYFYLDNNTNNVVYNSQNSFIDNIDTLSSESVYDNTNNESLDYTRLVATSSVLFSEYDKSINYLENATSSDASYDDFFISTNSNVKYSININTATIDDLTELPNIGEKTAQLIIDYRNTYGKFNDIKDIANVKRIGQKTYDKIKDMICVND